jgi:NAD(P)-dependent dehydrogenase (short-subunit alcohol dehydrogenase family)
MMNVNVRAPFRIMRAAVPHLKARKGSVVNVSSDAAIHAYPHWGAYGASKAALHHLSRIWDEELTDAHIRVLSIDPGDMDTPMHAAALPDADRFDLRRLKAAARTRVDRSCGAVAAHPESRGDGSGDSSMLAASVPIQRPLNAKLLVVDGRGNIGHRVRSDS